jgi:SAM-dependent methyltransferase
MTIDVDPDWWKTLFDEVYLVTDARSVGDEHITRQEIDIFTALIPLQPRDRILDLCGGHGRHALELCRRGFRDCTVLDYSQPLIDIGVRNAAAWSDSVRFVQGDARDTTLTAGGLRSRPDSGQLVGLYSGAACRPDHPAGELAPPETRGLAAAGRHRR